MMLAEGKGCVEMTKPTCGTLGEVQCVAKAGDFEYQCRCPGGLSGTNCATCSCLNGGTCNAISHDCDCRKCARVMVHKIICVGYRLYMKGGW